MAPRTVKAKKAAEVKEVETEMLKQGKKGKTVEDPLTLHADDDVEDNPKSKRGKRKPANGTHGQATDKVEKESAPPKSKKGKKEKDEEPMDDASNPDEDKASTDDNPASDIVETNGDSDEALSAPPSRGRKTNKKDAPKEKASETKSGRGRKNDKQEKEDDEEEAIVEKPVTKRGRGRKAQPKVEEPENDEEIEEAKPEKAPAKGRKKAVKAAKEKSPDIEEEEEKVEPKKKEAKGRKPRGKKAKEEAKEEQDEEEPMQTEEIGQGDAKEEADETPEADPKPVKGKRGPKKRTVYTPVDDEEPQDTGEPKKKKRAFSEEEKEKPPMKNTRSTEYEKLDFENNSKNVQNKDWNFKISSWNVDGIRAWLSKGGLGYIEHEKPDILCLQETKCSKEKLPDEITNLPGYHAYWLSSKKDGYAGVGIYTTKLAMNVQYGLNNEELDSEGRIITAEYEHFYLICTYVPNAGRGLVTLDKRLQWNEEFLKHVKELDKKKPVIICGDMNVAHNEIDLANPKTNKKNAGFTVEERTGMSELLGEGFVDTYRHLNPDKTGSYTFWTYMKNSRSKNVGWRLDYFIVSQRLLPSLCDSLIRESVFGSDHCPITMFLHLSSADKPKQAGDQF